MKNNSNISKQQLIELIEDIDKNIIKLQEELKNKDIEIKSLKKENQNLSKSNNIIVAKIREYTKELEKIKQSLCLE